MKCLCGNITFDYVGKTEDLVNLISCEKCGLVYVENKIFDEKENKNENKKND